MHGIQQAFIEIYRSTSHLLVARSLEQLLGYIPWLNHLDNKKSAEEGLSEGFACFTLLSATDVQKKGCPTKNVHLPLG